MAFVKSTQGEYAHKDRIKRLYIKEDSEGHQRLNAEINSYQPLIITLGMFESVDAIEEHIKSISSLRSGSILEPVIPEPEVQEEQEEEVIEPQEEEVEQDEVATE